jgi:hypothetical protein
MFTTHFPGNGKHTTFFKMVMTGGWLKWHCFTHKKLYVKSAKTSLNSLPTLKLDAVTGYNPRT